MVHFPMFFVCVNDEFWSLKEYFSTMQIDYTMYFYLCTR